MPNPPPRHAHKGQFICKLANLADGQAYGFCVKAETEAIDIILWHYQGEIKGFINKCPHRGLPLEIIPNRFLTRSGDALICSAHGARFDATGFCFAGPCQGQSLSGIDLVIKQGDIFLA